MALCTIFSCQVDLSYARGENFRYHLAMSLVTETTTTATEDLADRLVDKSLDLRLVLALAGDRELTAREESRLSNLKEERGESLFSDMLYALTHQTFPSRQAKTIWGDISTHRQSMTSQLGRDPGLSVATHDFLSNTSGLIKNLSLIEESKLANLADVATHDGLTGLIDKATFHRKLEDEIHRQHRYGGKLSLVLADIDHFKKLNDTFGHADGDLVLTQVADIIQQQARATDVAARFGGEEFSVLLIGVDHKAAYIFAERLRQTIETKFTDTPYKLTISLGLAESTAEKETTETLVRQADAALYAAKNGGRNTVCVS